MTRSLTAAMTRRNAAFAKHVRRFADRAAALPGFPMMQIVAVAATALLVVVGAFGTGALPMMTRTGFWAVLMGWSMVKWQAWLFLTVRQPRDWTRAVLAGAVLLNLPLPFEISVVLRLFGVTASQRKVPHAWIAAMAISAVVFVMLYLARLLVLRPALAIAAAPAIIPGGVLAKAGVASPAVLNAIRAEDHYCRLLLADGRTPLIHHRFGDALGEVARFDGCQVHRGVWAANAAVVAAERDGRAWRLVLVDGTRLAVSARFVPGLRANGWLNRTAGTNAR
ncbi:hypothetical protein BH10PSE14_BH10PSE14_43430 [soil metagenome]